MRNFFAGIAGRLFSNSFTPISSVGHHNILYVRCRDAFEFKICCTALLASVGFFSMFAGAALADDSSAALGAGGLELTKSADIRMAMEDLRISPDDVRIRYEFVNDGPKDIDTIVAFPLPDIDSWNFYEEPIGKTTDDPVNFVGFKATADGKPIAVKVEQRAFLGDRDVTALVTAAGAPVNVILAHNYEKLDKLPDAKKKMLERAGLAERDAPDQEHPKWTVRTRFYWTQHFPAHKTVVITHSYKPVTGQAFFSKYEVAAKPGSSDDAWKKPYCMDDKTIAAAGKMIEARTAKDQNDGLLNAFSVDFILKTANNWKGGIGRFHLTIDKRKPESILSLCWDGDLRRTGATTFESTRENFRPAADLKFVVLE